MISYYITYKIGNKPDTYFMIAKLPANYKMRQVKAYAINTLINTHNDSIEIDNISILH